MVLLLILSGVNKFPIKFAGIIKVNFLMHFFLKIVAFTRRLQSLQHGNVGYNTMQKYTPFACWLIKIQIQILNNNISCL